MNIILNSLIILIEDESVILNDTWNGTELLSHGHADVLSPTKPIQHQEENKSNKFIVDYDQHTSSENLMDNEELNYAKNYPDLNSRTVHTSNLPINRFIETPSNTQENSPVPKFSKISLISDHLTIMEKISGGMII
jgi:hypothetical protein